MCHKRLSKEMKTNKVKPACFYAKLDAGWKDIIEQRA